MLRKLHHRIGLSAAAALYLSGTVAVAAPPAQNALWVAKNGAAVIDLETEAGTVTVVNPDIADVAPAGGKRLILLGRTVGQTDLLVYDQAGNRLLAVALVVTPQLERTIVINRGVEEDTMVCAPVCASVSPRQNPPAGGGLALPGAGAAGGGLGGVLGAPVAPQ